MYEYMLIHFMFFFIFLLAMLLTKKARLNLCIAEYRDFIFSLRAELFLYIANNKLGFDDQLYKYLRDMLNGYLRSAEKIDIASLWSMDKNINVLKSLREFDEQETGFILHDVMNALDSKDKEYFNKIINDAGVATAKLIFKKNSVLTLLYIYKKKKKTLSISEWQNTRDQEMKKISKNMAIYGNSNWCTPI